MKEAFKKLFELLPAPDKLKFAALFVLMIIGTFLEVIGIGMVPIFVGAVANPDMLLGHDIAGPILEWAGITTSRELLTTGGILLVLIFFIKGVYLVWLNYVQSRFISNRYAAISEKLFNAYLHAPITFHLGRNTAELIRNINIETRYISNQIMRPFLIILMAATTITGIFLLLIIVEPIITLVALVLIGGVGGLILKILKKSISLYGQIAGKERERMIKVINEGLGGIKDVIVMNRQPYFARKFKHYVNNMVDAEIFKGVTTFSSRPVIEFVAVAGMMAIAFILVWQGRGLEAIIPVLTLFGVATVRLLPNVALIVNQLNNLRYYIHALRPVHADIKLLQHHADIAASERETGKLEFKKLINLENLWFRYPNSDEYVIKGINLQIERGSAVGFVGASGAGKSTIVDIILGFYEPEKGRIMVDNQNISANKRKWQNSVGYIPQFIFLSDDTIRNNIAFGLTEDQISEEWLQESVQAAQLESLIEELPEGLDTVIGERGTRLSGGQRQRIGIARALYSNPSVLVMDEATSALDNITEQHINEAIDKLKGERTIIMIAHRLTTVKNCDQLYVMENGRITENGNYDELMNNSYVFREMALESN